MSFAAIHWLSDCFFLVSPGFTVEVCCAVTEEETRRTTRNADVSRWTNPRPCLLQSYRLDAAGTAETGASFQAKSCKQRSMHYYTQRNVIV